eukprot:CAMPEP_0119116056 /NCGR_PEP_ID=MMETSP1180-20130426/52078_1 /TAXON_ID=3052 ORGANISM="Chlamydomonas cf sp, Strain CCMP681" /NCGR_SAMPLE_ID=MMETSP1180 /ASSEMBLY_ACC=CAM_ASM_000741 /LENGTH=223 /DNA_ID=CAMNT_0007105171 /DNA_START=389 /DNA_END=1060 /DNA_ORIENTATION=+
MVLHLPQACTCVPIPFTPTCMTSVSVDVLALLMPCARLHLPAQANPSCRFRSKCLAASPTTQRTSIGCMLTDPSLDVLHFRLSRGHHAGWVVHMREHQVKVVRALGYDDSYDAVGHILQHSERAPRVQQPIGKHNVARVLGHLQTSPLCDGPVPVRGHTPHLLAVQQGLCLVPSCPLVPEHVCHASGGEVGQLLWQLLCAELPVPRTCAASSRSRKFRVKTGQ